MAAPARPKKRPLWVYLMFDEADKTHNTTSIDVSRHPEVAVTEYNSGKRAHRKNGKKNRRDWRLEQWIGPFAKRRLAKLFHARWARSACALDVRTVRGAELALEENLTVFSFHRERLCDAVAKRGKTK